MKPCSSRRNMGGSGPMTIPPDSDINAIAEAAAKIAYEQIMKDMRRSTKLLNQVLRADVNSTAGVTVQQTMQIYPDISEQLRAKIREAAPIIARQAQRSVFAAIEREQHPSKPKDGLRDLFQKLAKLDPDPALLFDWRRVCEWFSRSLKGK